MTYTLVIIFGISFLLVIFSDRVSKVVAHAKREKNKLLEKGIILFCLPLLPIAHFIAMFVYAYGTLKQAIIEYPESVLEDVRESLRQLSI